MQKNKKPQIFLKSVKHLFKTNKQTNKKIHWTEIMFLYPNVYRHTWPLEVKNLSSIIFENYISYFLSVQEYEQITK